MDREQFFDAQVARLRALFAGKNEQYRTHGDNGALWGNLERIGAFAGISTERATAVLIAKHLLVLATPGAVDAEGVVSRCDDIALYAMLLAGRASS